MFGAEIFGHAFQLRFRQAAVVVEGSFEFREVGPGCDGGFKQGDVFAFGVGVVAEVGVAGFDEDDGFESDFAEDGGEEDAGVDAVGLTGVPHLVEEADVLDVGARGGVGGAGDGAVGDAAVEDVVPYGEDLFADCVWATLVA